jgi:cytohesin
MTDEFKEAIEASDRPRIRSLLAADPNLLRWRDADGNSVLHLARARDVLDYFLDAGAEVDSRNKHGWTPLYRSCIGSFWQAEALLKHGADVNARDDQGQTPLHLAAMFLVPECLEFLLGHGADIHATSEDGYTPLHAAIIGDGNERTANHLWTRGARRDIFGAAALGKIKFVRESIRIDPGLVHARDGRGMTPLHWAAMRNQQVIAELLLGSGADINARDQREETPLHKTVRPAYWGSFRGFTPFLLVHGADVNVANDKGMTPLHYAVTAGRSEEADMLIAKGADVNARDLQGRTPFEITLPIRRRSRRR